MPHQYILEFAEIDRTSRELVGGKAAPLGELSRMEGVRVPPGFCLTTLAYRQMLKRNPHILALLDQPATLATSLRAAIASAEFWPELESALLARLARFPHTQAFAVRSSASLEDQEDASCAGQQDTFLNVMGARAVLHQVRLCWASLYSDRAVSYRGHQGASGPGLEMAVLIQTMVFPQASGVLFTADPVGGHRQRVVIEACLGLGEGLVSGQVACDRYTVQHGVLSQQQLASKTRRVESAPGGATRFEQVPLEQQQLPGLSPSQVLDLAALGKLVEGHFGAPQDLEWALQDGDLFVLQSRPITTLFPLPEVEDRDFHIYVSVGHQQMMTDAFKPLGLSVWQATAARPMYTAGGRLFVDVAPDLASPAGRNVILNVLGKSDPLIRDAISTLLARDGVEAGLPVQAQAPADFEQKIEYDPELVPNLIAASQASLSRLREDLQLQSGAGVVDFILNDLAEQRKGINRPDSFAVIVTAMNAANWLREHLGEWLGEAQAVDVLSQSLDHNPTSRMGLAWLGVADIVRAHPQVIEYLNRTHDEDYLDRLPDLPGGEEIRQAILDYLEQYGMRATGEIDITRPRWSEQPLALLPVLMSNVRTFQPGEGRRRFQRGLQEAQQKERELLQRLGELPQGEEKAGQTRRMIELLRHYTGYREYPKYALISRYHLYKQALRREARMLLQSGVFSREDDYHYLSLGELREVLCTGALDSGLVQQRRDTYKKHERLLPPRVMTSEGEILNGCYQCADLPEGALVGLAVSSGVVEGRARVINDLTQAELEEGDILVTTYTDPSWTPLFVGISGLITEVGGLMTHGAVIAREYGLPAVVGVEGATRRIRDGQKLRLDGARGFVQFLSV